MSLQLGLLNLGLRLLVRPYLARQKDFAVARLRMERHTALLPMPEGARFTRTTLAHGGVSVPAAHLAAPAGAGDGHPVILWLHGGAYCIGSSRTHSSLVATLAYRAGAGAVLPDYRLAPEHPFPAAVDDAVAAYRALVADGLPPGRIVPGGDSAGGGLAFALLHLLLAEGAAPPAAVVAFSPWVDLTESGESLRTLARRDAMLPVERFAEIRDRYLAGADARDPRASPCFGRFAGRPPVLVQSSRAEALRDDARAIVARLRADGCPVEHDEWDDVPHVWQFFHAHVPEAARALDHAADFVRRAAAPRERP